VCTSVGHFVTNERQLGELVMVRVRVAAVVVGVHVWCECWAPQKKRATVG
jgi:hypothetical protein